MKTPVFSVFVEINPEQISEIPGSVTMIPFTGTVRGAWFNGSVAPGGTDTQVVDERGARRMSARYVLKGTDCAGQPCQIYVANEGLYTDGHVPSPFYTVPTFVTDSAVLSQRFRSGRFYGEGHPGEKGPIIRIYEEEDDL